MARRTLIAIPTYNESRDLPAVLNQLVEQGRDVLVVDDGSTDGSPTIARDHGAAVLTHSKNMGYGQSLIDAFEYAHQHDFDWVITMDADGQHEPESIPDFEKLIAADRYDLISGSRYLGATNDGDLPPPERRDINRRISAIMNRLFKLDLTDAFCGFKAHRVSAMRRLQLTETGYAFPLQFWPRVWRERLRLIELPVRRIYHDPNRSFGKDLDDARRRFAHYIGVLNAELRDMRMAELDEITGQPVQTQITSNASVCCGCLK